MSLYHIRIFRNDGRQDLLTEWIHGFKTIMPDKTIQISGIMVFCFLQSGYKKIFTINETCIKISLQDVFDIEFKQTALTI